LQRQANTLSAACEAAGLAMEHARNLLRLEAEARYAHHFTAEARSRAQDQADNLHAQAVRVLTDALAVLDGTP
jgi:hypothetical protein